MRIFLVAGLFLLFLSAKAQQILCKHIILIGFDGFGAYSVPNANMPNLKKMMDNGTYSLTCRSVLPSSSAVNWASLLMASPPELHGYTEWGSQTPELPSRVIVPGNIFPSIFGMMEQQRPELKTAVIFNWDGIGYLFERNMVDSVYDAATDSKVTFRAGKMIKEFKPNLLFLHFDEPDGAGHQFGHGTPEYYKQLELNDSRLGEILQSVKDAGTFNETLFIVTADHGGIEKGHGGKTMSEMQIPLVFYGAGVKKQSQLTQSIMIYDIGATIAWLFGLEFPQVWTGRPVKQAFMD